MKMPSLPDGYYYTGDFVKDEGSMKPVIAREDIVPTDEHPVNLIEKKSSEQIVKARELLHNFCIGNGRKPIGHWTDHLEDIHEDILPLVTALDSGICTPIAPVNFETGKTASVLLAVYPKKGKRMGRFAEDLTQERSPYGITMSSSVASKKGGMQSRTVRISITSIRDFTGERQRECILHLAKRVKKLIEKHDEAEGSTSGQSRNAFDWETSPNITMVKLVEEINERNSWVRKIAKRLNGLKDSPENEYGLNVLAKDVNSMVVKAKRCEKRMLHTESAEKLGIA